MTRYTIDPAQFTEAEWEQFTGRTIHVVPVKYRFHRDARPFCRSRKQVALAVNILYSHAATTETAWIAEAANGAAGKLEALLPQGDLRLDPASFREAGMTIRTSYVYPPIPTRRFDWCAWVDGHEESNNVGYGPTEAEAIADLKERLDEEEN